MQNRLDDKPINKFISGIGGIIIKIYYVKIKHFITGKSFLFNLCDLYKMYANENEYFTAGVIAPSGLAAYNSNGFRIHRYQFNIMKIQII